MQRRVCLRVLVASGLARVAAGPRAQGGAASGVPPEVEAELPGARLQGRGRLRYFGLHVYDARLWFGSDGAGEPAAPLDWTQRPLALELQYARALSGQRIAERSLEEMRRSGDLPAEPSRRWLAFMKQAFPDVDAADRITGVQRAGAGVRFYVNGRAGGALDDVEFARRFFGIWLGESSSQPALRKALLGGGA